MVNIILRKLPSHHGEISVIVNGGGKNAHTITGLLSGRHIPRQEKCEKS